jgi:integrase
VDSRGPRGRCVKHVAHGYDVTINGQRERRFSGEWTCENDALEAMLKRQRDAGAGIMPAAPRTLRELADEYLRYKAERGKRSLSEDRRMLNTRLLPALGADLLVEKLTAPAIAQYERRRGGEVGPYTAANELAVLRHMLRLGLRWGYLDKVPEIQMPKKPDGRRRCLDESEIDKLLNACRASRNPHLTTIVVLAINTGMRKSEILELCWERIDLSSARMTLYETKNGAPRGLPINRAVYDALIGLEAIAERRNGLVFKRNDGAAWGKVRTAFETAIKRAGLRGFRFHDLRHTAASHMVMRGATLKEVQEILGHKTFSMTLRYSHLSPAHLRGAVDRLDGLTGATPTAHGTAQNDKIPSATERKSLSRL